MAEVLMVTAVFTAAGAILVALFLPARKATDDVDETRDAQPATAGLAP
jgi:hypothetical protein